MRAIDIEIGRTYSTFKNGQVTVLSFERRWVSGGRLTRPGWTVVTETGRRIKVLHPKRFLAPVPQEDILKPDTKPEVRRV